MDTKTAAQIIGQHDGILRNNDMLIKSMCHVAEELIKFRYIYEKYATMEAKEMQEIKGTIKNSMAFLLGDLEVTMELLGITDQIKAKSDGRLVKVAKKMQ